MQFADDEMDGAMRKKLNRVMVMSLSQGTAAPRLRACRI